MSVLLGLLGIAGAIRHQLRLELSVQRFRGGYFLNINFSTNPFISFRAIMNVSLSALAMLCCLLSFG